MLTEAAHLYPLAPAEAWSLCAEAFYLLRKDTYYSAWWRYNLGMMRLRQLDLAGAECHFHELKILIKLEGAASFRVCAYNGFAASKRLLGDLEQALIEYQRAKKLGQKEEPTKLNEANPDLTDLEIACWGVGLVLRLQGRADEAMGYFLEAQGVQGKPWLCIEQAVCCVLLGDLEGASKRLPSTLPRDIRSRNLCLLVQAEIARAKRQDVLLQATLEGISYQDYSLAEEWNCFAVVLQEAQARGFLVPPAIVKAQTKVRIQANGILQVWVNQNPVSIKAAGYPAQLLVYLLEQGGQAALEGLTEALFETRATEHNKARQALWVHVKSLRTSLGWEKSVIALSGAYQLDPQAEWDYDIAKLRRLGERPRAFLTGVGSDWAMQTLRDFDKNEFDI